MKKLAAVLLSIIMVLSLVSGVSYAAEENISVTVKFDASVVAADMDALYSDLRTSGIVGEETTNLPSDITVTVPKGSSVKDVIEKAVEERNFTIVGLSDNYITQVGYVGSSVLENLVSTSVGNYYSGNIFSSAGWSFYIDRVGLMAGIDAVPVNTDGAVIEGRYGLAVGWDSNWNAVHYDEMFLEAYNKLKELAEKDIDTSALTEAQIEKLNSKKAEAEALLSEIYNEASLNDEVSALLKTAHPSFKTSGGMWIGYMEKKDVSFWGTGSPTEKLENAIKELNSAINPLPENLLSELYVTTLFGTAEDNLVSGFKSDKYEYVIVDFTKENSLPKFMKFKSVATSEDATVSVCLNGESINASSLSDNWNQYSSLDWDNNVCNVLTFTVTPPEQSAESETVYTVKIFSGEEIIVVTPLTKEERDEKISELLENIAESYAEKSSYWEVMDMGAYKKYAPETEKGLSKNAQKAFVNMSISEASESTQDTTLAKAILALTASGYDATRLYKVNNNTPIDAIERLDEAEHSTSVWSAPYTLAAYNREEFKNREKETALVTALLASQGENGAWDEYGTIDTTANAIAGLSFYMNDEDSAIKARVNTAIENALGYLSTQQNEDGSFSDSWSGRNSNSTAMVAIALAAAGVDVESDERFIKGGMGIIDGLLSFALEENTAFGYTDNITPSDYSTEQAFRALIALAGAIKTGAAYNVYDFNGIELSPVRATDEYTGGNAPSDPQGDQITVTLAIKADDDYWLRGYRVTLPGSGATIYHAFVKACQENGLKYEGADNGYVSAISNGKKTLAEFGAGKNSGWLYKLNGEAPLLGIRECSIKNGDSVLFLYTTDYTKEAGFGRWEDDEDDEIITEEKEETTEEKNFNDVGENHWAREYIYDLAERGILNGRGSGFAPEDNITRAEFVAILSRICGEEITDGENSFTDVAEDAWYAKNVSWAVKTGITKGVSGSSFAPNANITREDMAVMLMRYVVLKGITLKEKISKTEFKDESEISVYAKDAVFTMQRAGIISGIGNSEFAPKSFATRAQAAKMISMIIIAMEEGKKESDEEKTDLLSISAKNICEVCKNPTVSSVGGEWAVIGLARSRECEDEKIFSNYLENLKKVLSENNGVLHKRKYTEYARVVLALSAIGENPSAFSGYDLVAPLADVEKVTSQGINGAVWALIALDSKGYMDDENGAETRDMYVNEILSKALPVGGWSLGGEAPAEADITAMALVALAPYMEKKEVSAVAEKALSALSSMQSENGSFLSEGKETCESTAQVLVSLCSLGIATDDERFVKNGNTITDALSLFHVGNGSFCHTLDDKKPSQMSGEQAFYALVSLERYIRGESAIFDMR